MGISIAGKRYYTCNYQYFDVLDSAEKAYWLGFLMADGCIMHTSRIRHLKTMDSMQERYYLQLSLSDLLKELAAENGEDMREPELQAIKNGTKHTDEPVNKCPVCGAELVAEGGCNICKACGYDKCDQ